MPASGTGTWWLAVVVGVRPVAKIKVRGFVLLEWVLCEFVFGGCFGSLGYSSTLLLQDMVLSKFRRLLRGPCLHFTLWVVMWCMHVNACMCSHAAISMRGQPDTALRPFHVLGGCVCMHLRGVHVFGCLQRLGALLRLGLHARLLAACV